MANTHDPLELTRELIRIKSVTPPGDEYLVADYLTPLLEGAGFQLSRHEFGPGRTNLIARLEGAGNKPPLCFTGHFDVVPLGENPWSMDPFGAQVDGGKLYGRGSSDMKSGVAAIVTASLRLSELNRAERPGLILVFTAGEETGCQGAWFLAGEGDILDRAGAMVVAEPTSNQPMLGHKGAIWLTGRTSGKTAHGSMPQAGDNAVYKAARAIVKLEEYGFSVGNHPQLGAPTLNVGTVKGGMAPNIVPDWAEFGLDIRTVPGQNGLEVIEEIKRELGPEVEFDPVKPADGVWTDGEDPWIGSVFDILEELEGERPMGRGISYMTDASALIPAMGKPPALILGPGEASQAHQTDEFCLVENISRAEEIYFRIGRAWAS